MTEPRNYYASLDLLTQEYRAALRDLYSEHLPPHVRQRRVDELNAEFERRRVQEMKVIREQREEGTSAH